MEFLSSIKLYFLAKITTATFAVSWGIISSDAAFAALSERHYNNVTPKVLACIITAGEKRTEGLEPGGKIEYEPEANNPNIGTVRIPSFAGIIILKYALNPSARTLKFTLEEKPLFVSTETIWNEYNATVIQCGGLPVRASKQKNSNRQTRKYSKIYLQKLRS